MKHHVFLGLLAGLLTGFTGSLPAPAQDEAPAKRVELPELKGYKLPDGDVLILGARMSGPHADFIRKLRNIPSITTDQVPSSLLIDKYLHRKSQAIDTEFCYLESDWLSSKELSTIANATRHAIETTQGLFDGVYLQKITAVLLQSKDNYYAMVDGLTDVESLRKHARSVDSTFIANFRCGYRSDLTAANSLVLADAILRNVPKAFWHHKALSHGLHTYLTSLIALRYETFVAVNTTTPSSRQGSAVRALFETARDVLSRPKRESLETVLRSELNSLTLERLSVSVALIHYLLQEKLSGWKAFCAALHRESMEGGKIKGPEGRLAALKTALQEGFSLSLAELDRELQAFAERAYPHPEEQAILLGVKDQLPPAQFETFAKVCAEKRQQKPVSEKGEKVYEDVLKRMGRILEDRGVGF